MYNLAERVQVEHLVAGPVSADHGLGPAGVVDGDASDDGAVERTVDVDATVVIPVVGANSVAKIEVGDRPLAVFVLITPDPSDQRSTSLWSPPNIYVGLIDQ